MNGKPKKIHLRKIENSAKVGIEGNYERPKANEIFSFFNIGIGGKLRLGGIWAPMGIMSRLIYSTENVSTTCLIFSGKKFTKSGKKAEKKRNGKRNGQL